ncbi:PREDICTED: probable cation transporter HKT7 [Nelumbo nucifera]|uniref:Probable cation transporter HKT7 n=1 Tax=Nelumbo nucifera TaxID=4432 RepID=A0A1U8AD63_NELNU|nr:PREDICTED: probable cation transporter HKT7 [Nelumbo nucifera]
MKNLTCLGNKLEHLCSSSCIKVTCLSKSFWCLMVWPFLRFLIFHLNPLWVQICYFVSISFMGFLVLKTLNPRPDSIRPKDLDVFFMSVSASTVSSMSTIEMEVFSNAQLVVLTVLMLLGGEVFLFMLELQIARSKSKKQERIENREVDSIGFELSSSCPRNVVNRIDELGLIRVITVPHNSIMEARNEIKSMGSKDVEYNSIKYLNYSVLGYFLVIHVVGSALILLYLIFVPSAGDVLKNKNLQIQTFSVFTTVSTFANCGFLPTNENLIVFRKDAGLLLLLIPQVLLGNTLFPPCLRFMIWVLWRLSRREEFNYILNNTREMGYIHLFPNLHSFLLVVTVFGFILIQFILFCSMEWNSESLAGMNPYQKLVGALFQTVNSRHAGESIIDLSIVSPAILVLFVVMMYLPPYTSFLPIKDEEKSQRTTNRMRRRESLLENLIFSQLSYLVMFIILICITERKKMKEDPLNFTVLNIIMEVISAYGNVGFTSGYSCKRQLKLDSHCKDTWYGFSGRWSNKGKLILILVMFFGRLKKFNMEGGRGWKLL